MTESWYEAQDAHLEAVAAAARAADEMDARVAELGGLDVPVNEIAQLLNIAGKDVRASLRAAALSADSASVETDSTAAAAE